MPCQKSVAKKRVSKLRPYGKAAIDFCTVGFSFSKAHFNIRNPDSQEGVNKKLTENIITIKNEDDNMSIFKAGGKTYYTRRVEAEAVRRKGDRIYYSTEYKAYYIRRIKEPFWGW